MQLECLCTSSPKSFFLCFKVHKLLNLESKDARVGGVKVFRHYNKVVTVLSHKLTDGILSPSALLVLVLVEALRGM